MATETITGEVLTAEQRWFPLSWPAYMLFFLMVFLPVSQNTLMGWLIGITVSLIAIGVLLGFKRIALDRSILLWSMFYFALGLSYITLGLNNGNPGATFSILVFVLWPLVFLLFISAGSNLRIITNLLRIMVIATIAIGLAAINYALWSYGWLPDELYFDINVGRSIGFYEGYTEMGLYNLSSLIFLVPFLITSLMVYSNDYRPFMRKRWLWLALTLGLIAVLLGGRRALLLVTFIAPVFAGIFISWLPGRLKLTRNLRILFSLLGLVMLVVVAGILLSMAFEWNWQGVTTMFLEGFDFESDESAWERQAQYYSLVDSWKENKLFGAGLGAATTYSRSERPWEYELQYVLLLFHTGIIGFILYSSGVVWIYRKAYLLIRSGTRLSPHMIPVMTGTSCFLVANATNPYLQAFGHLWTLFLPIGMINYWLLDREAEKGQAAQAAIGETGEPYVASR